MSDLLELARRNVELGYTIVPVHSVGPDRKTCSCPRGSNCGKNAGKHPIGDGWQTGTEGGLEALEQMIEKGRKPNFGILPEASGIVTVDIDPRNGGDVTMAEFVKKYGQLPRTRVRTTGSGGWHYDFLAPKGVRLEKELGPGIDLKYNGMVVAEGSRSWSGEYRIVTDVEPVEMPAWIIEEARKRVVERPTPSPRPPKAGADPNDPDFERKRRYLTSAKEGELARLKEMCDAATPGGVGYTGPHWDDTVYKVACNLFEIANAPESDFDAKEAADLVLEHSPRDEGFNEERILRKIASARDRIGSTARDVPAAPVDPFAGAAVSAVDGAGQPAELTPLQRLPRGNRWKDSDMALAFAEHHARELRYSNGLGWLVWSQIEGRWIERHEDLIVGMSDDFARDVVAEVARSGDADATKAASSRLSAAAIAATVRLARGKRALQVEAGDLDADPTLLNATNGYVDLVTGNLIEHNPDKMMTKVTGCAYNPGATHPDVDRALEALDEDEREFFQLACGQAITGSPPPEDFLLLLHGGGANGKSALVGTLLEVAGTYGTLLSERVILANDSAHPTEMTDLMGARIAVLEELPESGTLNAKRVKSIVGTPEMSARKVHKDSIRWKASHTVFITTNHRPRITETDHGLWRRLALLTFPYRFVPSQSMIETGVDRVGDLGLRHRLTLNPQKEAFLAWVVEGARKYLAGGERPLALTPKMESEKAEWRHGMDPTGRFLEEMVDFEPGYCIASNDLYEELSRWLSANGHVPWSSQTATTRLESHHDIIQAGVDRKRFTVNGSSPEFSYRGPAHIEHAPGQKVRAWVGMKWKADA